MTIINVMEDSDIRIDKYLLNKLDISRSKIQKLIENEKIIVNNLPIKPSYTVKIDDEITIDDNYNEKVEIKPENIPLDIVYEDDDLLVVNKPSGMVVHPAPGNFSHTLVNALMYHCNNNLSNINGEVRPGIVHRIDADTSGLLLVAKNDKAHLSLAHQISEKSVTRKYVALVSGIIKEDSATIDAPIGRDKNNRKRMCVTSENSKDAITNIKVLDRYKDATLIECSLLTGRTHQIRVHMNYIGHPIINDPVYGKCFDTKFGQMLHAREIGFIHPSTNEYMCFSKEPPMEFMKILEEYRNE